MISKSITEGFKFALSVKRVILYIIVDLIVFYILISFFSGLLGMIRSESFSVLRFLLSLGLFVPAFIIIGLVQVWINGAMIDQAKYFPRERPLKKSFEYSISRYWSMLGALVIYAVINSLLSMPKYIGTILVLGFSLIMYYLYPVIIVGKKRCVDAFKKSYKIFMRYPLETFITWLLQGIISLIVIVVFALPLILLFLGNIVDIFVEAIPVVNGDVGSEAFIKSFMPGVLAAVRSPFFVPYLFVLVVGLSFTKVFNLGVQTRLYINARKMAL